VINCTHAPTKTQHTQGYNGYAHYITTMWEKPAGKKEKSLVKNTSNQTVSNLTLVIQN